MDVNYTYIAAAAVFMGFVSTNAEAAEPTASTLALATTSTAPTSSAAPAPAPAPSSSMPPAKSTVPIAMEKPLTITERRHTMAVLEGGIIALPNAPISASQRGGSVPFTTVGHGDATIQTGVRLLYRGGKDWIIGVGALFGPAPTTDSEYGGLKQLPRTHARDYMVFSGEGRYIPIRTGSFEGWVGLQAGGVVVGDRFTTEAGDDVPSIVGKKEVTINTEGFMVGIQAGLNWNFAERWGAGVVVRGNQWILPSSATCSPIGDCSTLQGSVQSFDAGLSIGYRIPL